MIQNELEYLKLLIDAHKAGHVAHNEIKEVIEDIRIDLGYDQRGKLFRDYVADLSSRGIDKLSTTQIGLFHAVMNKDKAFPYMRASGVTTGGVSLVSTCDNIYLIVSPVTYTQLYKHPRIITHTNNTNGLFREGDIVIVDCEEPIEQVAGVHYVKVFGVE
jgi:hypothetical protein